MYKEVTFIVLGHRAKIGWGIIFPHLFLGFVMKDIDKFRRDFPHFIAPYYEKTKMVIEFMYKNHWIYIVFGDEELYLEIRYSGIPKQYIYFTSYSEDLKKLLRDR